MKTFTLGSLALTFVAVFALCAPFSGCAGTETTNPLKSFEGSECKLHTLGPDVDTSRVALTLDDDAGADTSGDAGLAMITGVSADAGATMPPVVSCVSYEAQGDSLHVTAMNFRAACGIELWDGDARFEGDTLVVKSKNANRGCSIAGCGSCIYDFVYEVSGAPSKKAIPLRVEVGECSNGDAINRHSTTLTLPLDKAASGTVCRDAAGMWHAK